MESTLLLGAVQADKGSLAVNSGVHAEGSSTARALALLIADLLGLVVLDGFALDASRPSPFSKLGSAQSPRKSRATCCWLEEKLYRSSTYCCGAAGLAAAKAAKARMETMVNCILKVFGVMGVDEVVVLSENTIKREEHRPVLIFSVLALY